MVKKCGWYRYGMQFLPIIATLLTWNTSHAFASQKSSSKSFTSVNVSRRSMTASEPSTASFEGASNILIDWDRRSQETGSATLEEDQNKDDDKQMLPGAIRTLLALANEERAKDSTKGRCMLGICASSMGEGVQTLKSWVTALRLPRGLLHGTDIEGVPIEVEGGVYIKYNTGGCLTFSQIRKSGQGFDALWKPGDAMLEPYDGTYRGVYFQVELEDRELRQFFMPLDTFALEG